MRQHIPTSQAASSEKAAVRWAMRAVFLLAFALAWWLRASSGEDDGFASNVVETARWFTGRSGR